MHRGRGADGAGGAERMAERDGAAERIDLCRIQAQFADHGDRLRGEGLVEFDPVEIVLRDAGLLECARNRRDRADAHDLGRHAHHGRGGQVAPERPVGQVEAVTGSVRVVRAGQERPVRVGEPISGDDEVHTGADGHIAVVLWHNQVTWQVGPGQRRVVGESLAWRARSLKAVFRDAEFRFCMAVMSGIIVTACAYLYFSGKFPLWESVYHGFFQTASVITDNGLGTIGYPADWPVFVPLLLLLGSFFGGCVGSTCGGIKAIRFLLLYKQSVREARLLIRPSAQIAVKLGNHPIPDRVMQAVWGFYYLYIFSYCFFSLALTATGVDLVTAFGTVAACINNMGIGLGETAGGFGVLNDTATWLMVLAMLVGRLEVFPLLLIFLPDFWK